MSEHAHLMLVSKHLGELVTIRRLESQTLPERARPTTEQPRRRRTLCDRAFESEAGQRATGAQGSPRWAHRHTPDQRVLAVGADFVPGAANDLASLIAPQPQPDAWRIQTTQGQIGLTQERCQRLNIRGPARLKIHAHKSSMAPRSDRRTRCVHARGFARRDDVSGHLRCAEVGPPPGGSNRRQPDRRWTNSKVRYGRYSRGTTAVSVPPLGSFAPTA